MNPIMSNELKCCVLVHGPENEVAAFTGEFARDQFQAHLPIPADAEPQKSCEPIYKSRRLAEEHWGTRFIYQPRPGISIHLGVPPIVENQLRRIAQERYEGYRLPNPDDGVALITFTVPTDPPALWADHVIRRHYERGLRFMFRWWDQDNYHRCVRCGALDGICLRAGAFWSIDGGDHSACWYGENRCHCSGECNTRVPGAEADDDAMVSMTAFVDDPAIRVVSTFRTGRRSMMRLEAMVGDADRVIQEINCINHVLHPQLPVEQE
jgi:hypothetical protein